MPQSKEDFFRCIYSDNDIRVAGKRDLEGDLKLWERNEKLLDEEAALIKKYAGNSGLPVVFIVGVPRSGTTLLTQLMASCLDIGYIPNAVASYWMTPVYGMKKYLEDFDGFQHNNTYDSFLGNTGGPHDPSEFGWFWQYHLGNDGCDELNDAQKEAVDWQTVGKSLRAITIMATSALFVKALVYTNFIIKELANLLPSALFIRVERDPIFTCQSLLESRKRRYGSTDHWWSIKPNGWEEWIKEEAEIQVARQYYRTHRRISDQLTDIDPKQLLNLSYKSLVNEPDNCVQEIANFTNCKINTLPDFPAKKANVKRCSSKSLNMIADELSNCRHD